MTDTPLTCDQCDELHTVQPPPIVVTENHPSFAAETTVATFCGKACQLRWEAEHYPNLLIRSKPYAHAAILAAAINTEAGDDDECEAGLQDKEGAA